MTNSELSNEFDVLYNNITSNQAPGLNEYEKSVFLTKAQSQLVNEYFNNRTDGFGGGFDGSQKRQYDFSSLTRVANLFEVNTFTERISNLEKLDKRSKVYLFPHNYYLAVNEVLSDEARQYSVIPLTHLEYQRLMLKPYSMPVKKAAWRLFTDKKNCNYCRVKEGDDYNAEYIIMSSWADSKRNISITISSPDEVKFTESVSGNPFSTYEINGIKYTIQAERFFIYFKDSDFEYLVRCSSEGWNSTYTTYSIKMEVQVRTLGYTSTENEAQYKDDKEIMNIIKQGYLLFNKYIRDNNYTNNDWRTIKVGNMLDYFQQCFAPSGLKQFANKEGKTFKTEIIQVPVAEIIGKFNNNNPNYQLRYIKTLNPIILDDLSNYGEDISIDSIITKSECELPEETHQEILERAVTLAKIAWQGGTMTQAQTKE
jgi:hypothetical protein